MSDTLQKKLRILDKKQIANLYRSTFESEAGQLVLQDMKNNCFADRSVYALDDNDKLDTNKMIFNEGRRSVVIGITNAIRISKGEGEQDV